MHTLDQLKEGEKGVIVKVKGRGAFRKRIIEMGFVKGKIVKVIKAAPLLDPIEYEILNSHVSLRKNEASLIEVISVSEAVENGNSHFGGVISEEVLQKNLKEKGRKIEIALVGNPNSGKTTLFNHASKSHEHVGNYAGITIESKKAGFKLDGYTFSLTDLPGTYSLTHYTPEELFIRMHLLDEVPDIVINVIDASNLERNLYLTTQLIDMDLRVIVALNMYDELRIRGDDFDYDALGRMLGIPFIPTVASKGTGVNELFRKAIEVFEDREPIIRHIHINYGADIEEAISQIQAKIILSQKVGFRFAPRYYAIKLLEKDEQTIKRLRELDNFDEIYSLADKHINLLEKNYKDDSETLITDARYGFIEGALRETFSFGKRKKGSRSLKVDFVVTGKYFSYPLFIFFMWVVFQATFLVGQYPVKWIEQLIAFIGNSLSGIMPDSIMKDLLIDGIIGGVGGVVVFLPNILILFFFISVMEDSGYMARVAFIIDKLMHKIGLHGKSFIPLLMGFGCNVPAIMATRTIENRNDRLVTMLVTPFMSCSARYPVYILLISAFFTRNQGTILFSLYIFGIFLAGLIALLFKKTLFRSKEMPFVMELPPYRIPTAKGVFRHTWFKGREYLKKMGGIILIASVVIWALGYFPQYNAETEKIDKEIYAIKQEGFKLSDNEIVLSDQQQESIRQLETDKLSKQQEYSIIGHIGKSVEPIIRPLGFDWKMGISLIAGAVAKEVVISTMGVIYQAPDEDGSENTLVKNLQNEAYTSGPRKGEKVFSPLVAFTFMVFVLIYFPCIAVIAAVRKESGRWKYSAFLAIYTTALAWFVSLIIYQIGSLIIA